eukprot:jgi/Chlat1/2772/Chrsp187S02945
MAAVAPAVVVTAASSAARPGRPAAATAAASRPAAAFTEFSGLRAVSRVDTCASSSSSHAATRPGAVQCVATPAAPPSAKPAKRSKVEIIKENSDFLRHPLLEELETEASNISDAAAQLIKFHGSYQQDDREKRTFGKGKYYQFMMRTKQPAGKLYLTMDDLADKYGNGTLRLTTRQTYQLHGVLKEDMKTVFSTVIKNMGSTLGACGDLNRNVLAPPPPYTNRPDYAAAVKGGAYYDVWLNGEKFISSQKDDPEVTDVLNDNSHGTNFVGSPEPIYGTQFLPRKFKVAVTVPGDNSVDLLTNDVGGGMGRTHRDEETFARLAEPLGYVPKEDVLYAMKAIICTQRDYGRRDDRRQSRMKYLIHDWGIERFRTVVEQYYGKKIEEFRPLPKWEFKDFLGWHEQGDGKLFYGVQVENGRLKGEMKQALRRVVERYELPVRITANQNLILCDVYPAWKRDIVNTLKAADVKDVSEVDDLVRKSMACPALPLCGLAIGEAERTLPDINKRLRTLLTQVGLQNESFVIRMTGCPNGCARPYMAELGLVGDGPNSYQIWLGGCPNQTRLARAYADKVKFNDFESFLEPLFFFFKTRREGASESFGDFCNRVGFEVLREYQRLYVSPMKYLNRPRVALDEDVFSELQKAAEERGTTLSQLAGEAIKAYVGSSKADAAQ